MTSGAAHGDALRGALGAGAKLGSSSTNPYAQESQAGRPRCARSAVRVTSDEVYGGGLSTMVTSIGRPNGVASHGCPRTLTWTAVAVSIGPGSVPEQLRTIACICARGGAEGHAGMARAEGVAGMRRAGRGLGAREASVTKAAARWRSACEPTHRRAVVRRARGCRG